MKKKDAGVPAGFHYPNTAKISVTAKISKARVA
jgi:hypothetical protein